MVSGRERQLHFKKLLTFIVTALVISALFTIAYGNHTARAQVTASDFISEPGKIPFMANFQTPELEPGESGMLRFSITNRYNEFNLVSNNMIDVELTLGIYEYATLEESRKVDSAFKFKPEIEKEISTTAVGGVPPADSSGIITIEPETGIKLFRFHWPILPENSTYKLELLINSDENTPEGVYFIKTELNFRHSGIENKSFTMRSKGFFTDDQWENAKTTAHEDFLPGINLTSLDIDGIIPETSFSIRVPTPKWPLYVLVSFAVFFILLAVIFFYMEEHDKFPNLKAKLDKMGKRFK